MIEDKVKFILKMIKINFKYIFQNSMRIAGVLYSAFTVVLSFVSWEEINIRELGCRIFALLSILMGSFLIGSVYTLLVQRIKNLWCCGDRSIDVRYLDMVKLAFSKIRTTKKIMVIPVNTGFDTIVDSDPGQRDPLVSPNSLHGEWIKEMIRHGVTVEKLNKKIKAYLDDNYPGEETIVNKFRGNNFSYPYGTTVVG